MTMMMIMMIMIMMTMTMMMMMMLMKMMMTPGKGGCATRGGAGWWFVGAAVCSTWFC